MVGAVTGFCRGSVRWSDTFFHHGIRGAQSSPAHCSHPGALIQTE